MENKAGHIGHPAVCLDEIKEQSGRQQSILRVLPAHEHLGACHAFRCQIDFGLKHHAEFVALERLIDVRCGKPEGPVTHGAIKPLSRGPRAACHRVLTRAPLKVPPPEPFNLNCQILNQNSERPMTDAKIPPTPLPSATILLLRDGARGIEVFMVKRHHQIDFASGALVFPGGKVDRARSRPQPCENLRKVPINLTICISV